jgi:hypothetical protein
MTLKTFTRTALVLGLLAGAGATAQLPTEVGKLPGMSGGGAMPTLGGGLPDMSSIGAGNAAGVLKYCLQNKLLGGAAGGELGTLQEGLAGKPDVAASPDYAAGQTGQLRLQDGSQLSLDSLPPEMKTKACDMVLKHAKSLL